MKYTNLLEKIGSLFTIAQDSWVNLGFLVFFAIILLLFCMKKISKKTSFILSLIGDISLIIYTIVIHYESVSQLMNNIMKHLFTDIYFPSIYVYLFVFFFINFVTIGSLLNIRKKGFYHTINGVAFLIINFIFALILDIISKNQIDVFSKSSLFSNTDLIILLEFSVTIFGIWLLSLGVVSLTNIISERILLHGELKLERKKPKLISDVQLQVNEDVLENTSMEDTFDTNLEPEKEPILQMIEEEKEPTTNKFIPTFEQTSGFYKQMMIEETLKNNAQSQEEFTPLFVPTKNPETLVSKVPTYLEQDYLSTIPTQEFAKQDTSLEMGFDLSSFIPRKQENHVIEPVDTNKIFEQILNNQLPLAREKEVIKNEYESEKNSYTLNDYRIFNKMLKDIKDHNQSNTIQIDKMLEYRLITKYSSETYDMFKRMLKNYSN